MALSLFNLLQFPLAVFPSVISAMVEASVSFKRLFTFLTAEELDQKAINYESVTVGSFENGKIQRIKMDHGYFNWGKPNHWSEAMLRDISFSCTEGMLIEVVGTVGAGKSSLISALLGEMHKVNGSVTVRGSVAYVSQSPWLMNATLRDNILFGKPYHPTFYQETVKACGLVQDLQMLPGGDLTEIGERGITLSGGQKQRISLARAVYADADIYLLDDTLSAVDAHVGKHIFKHVIGSTGLLKSKARIFVTHAIQYLSKADKIIQLEKGEIKEMGTYQELMAKKGVTFSLVNEYGKEKDISAEKEDHEQKLLKKQESLKLLPQESPTGQLMTKEESAKGSVSKKVYKAYGEACSWNNVIIYLVIAILSQVLSILQNVYLADWADSNDKQLQNNVFYRLGIYGLLGLTYSTAVIVQVVYVWVFCGIQSARVLHDDLLDNVMR